MKTLTLIFTLVFTVMFSSTSFAEWEKVGTDTSGGVWYVDYNKIKVNGSSVYFWKLLDYISPDEDGAMSMKVYSQVECDLKQSQNLKYASYKLSMGEGPAHIWTAHNKKWRIVRPNTMINVLMKNVCRFAK